MDFLVLSSPEGWEFVPQDKENDNYDKSTFHLPRYFKFYDNATLCKVGQHRANQGRVANEKAWCLMDEEVQENFMVSAGAAINTVLELEPRMAELDNDELTLEFQKDGQGVKGDVRDIVIKRKDIEWEVGLSIKHNHDAVKHSRLSHKLDFGNEWFEMR